MFEQAAIISDATRCTKSLGTARLPCTALITYFSNAPSGHNVCHEASTAPESLPEASPAPQTVRLYALSHPVVGGPCLGSQQIAQSSRLSLLSPSFSGLLIVDLCTAHPRIYTNEPCPAPPCKTALSLETRNLSELEVYPVLNPHPITNKNDLCPDRDTTTPLSDSAQPAADPTAP